MTKVSWSCADLLLFLTFRKLSQCYASIKLFTTVIERKTERVPLMSSTGSNSARCLINAAAARLENRCEAEALLETAAPTVVIGGALW